MSNKAVFLDRDGVINEEVSFIHKPEQVKFMPGIFDFCADARKKGYKLLIATNQSGIARGLFSEPDFNALMRWMLERFDREGCPIDAYYYCPHHPEAGHGIYKKACECRKPKPGMILQAAEEWNIDLRQSLLLGDQPRDIEAGKAAGVGTNILFDGSWPGV